MNRLDKVRYTAKIHTTDGREGGASPTSDGRPEIVAGKMKVVLPADLAINASSVPIFPIRRRRLKRLFEE